MVTVFSGNLVRFNNETTMGRVTSKVESMLGTHFNIFWKLGHGIKIITFYLVSVHKQCTHDDRMIILGLVQ